MTCNNSLEWNPFKLYATFSLYALNSLINVIFHAIFSSTGEEPAAMQTNAAQHPTLCCVNIVIFWVVLTVLIIGFRTSFSDA